MGESVKGKPLSSAAVYMFTELMLGVATPVLPATLQTPARQRQTHLHRRLGVARSIHAWEPSTNHLRVCAGALDSERGRLNLGKGESSDKVTGAAAPPRPCNHRRSG